MRAAIWLAVGCLSAAAASAQTSPSAPPAEALQQAMGQVLGEAGQREVATLAQAYAFKARAEAAEAKIAELTKKLDAAKARDQPASNP